MPLYSYQCTICDSITDYHRSVDDRHNSPICKCGQATELVILPANIAPILGGGDFQGYHCPVTDKWVTSRRERKRIMDEHNLVETGDRGNTRGRMMNGFKPGEDRGSPD